MRYMLYFMTDDPTLDTRDVDTHRLHNRVVYAKTDRGAKRTATNVLKSLDKDFGNYVVIFGIRLVCDDPESEFRVVAVKNGVDVRWQGER